MKRISMILMAFVLVLTMTQCKKNEETNQDKTVTITLDIKNNNGSKVDVNTITGTVNFETGDKVYVGSGGKYVGTLTHNGTNFTGNITNPTEGQPLQFFFLGNVTPAETLTAGSTEECSVIISDQTEHLPVISYAPSFENYVSGVTAYTGHLLNKCALVKFNVTTPSNSPICITGMKNKVIVDFSENTVTPSMDGEGIIKLPAGSGDNVEKWAILLPQEALPAGGTGSIYSVDGEYVGTRGAVSTINENDYMDSGIDAILSVQVYVNLDLPSGLLWATHNVGANSSEDYGDYFAWGESEPKSSYWWDSYKYCHGSYNTLTKYCSDVSYGYNGFTDNLTILQPNDDVATVNWDERWRMPTKEDWEELYQNTTNTWITQNNVNGRLFIASNGNSLFLPSAGYYYYNTPRFVGSGVYYWSSMVLVDQPEVAWLMSFGYDYSFNMVLISRSYGLPVRPVRSVR